MFDKGNRVLCMCLVIAMLAGLAPLLGTARVVSAIGPSTTTWDTTADFDSGTKANGTAQRNFFASNGVSQPTNWVAYPSAAYGNGRTFVVYQGPNGAGAASNPSPYITFYNGTAWTGPMRITNGPLTNDDHGSPSILLDSSGFIHVFFGAHSTAIKHVVSTSAYSIESWVSKPDIYDLMTYPHPILMSNGTIYLIVRESSFDNTKSWIDVIFSTNGGTTWSPLRKIIGDFGANTGIYVGAIDFRNDQIHLEFDFNDLTANRFNAYHAILNATNQKVYCLPLTDVGTPLTLANANSFCRRENTGTRFSEFGGVHLDASGNPYLIYPAQPFNNNWRYRFQYWTGSAWTAPINITDAKGYRNYCDFIVSSVSAIEAYLVTGGIEGGSWRGGNIEKWTWNGAAWSKALTVLNDSFASHPLASPMVPRNFGSVRLIFNEINVDNYSALGAGQLLSYAFDGTNLVKGSDDLGVYSLESVTDDSLIAPGTLELASGKGDAFTHIKANGYTLRWHVIRWISGTDLDSAQQDISTSSSGRLYQTITTGSGGVDSYGVSSEFTFTGDFNVSVHPQRQGSTSGTHAYIYVINEDCGYWSCTNTVDGIMYEQFWQTPTDRRLIPNTITNGVITQGTNSFPADADYYMRLVRVGTTVSYWYSADGSSWTRTQSLTFSFSGSLHLVMVTSGNSLRSVAWTMDDFRANVITFANNLAYATTGSWTNPKQAFTGLYPKTVSVTYSGASATYTLSLDIVNTAGFVLDHLQTPITSGTSFSWSISPNEGEFAVPWAVRATLAGDGQGTAVLDIVRVTTDSLTPFGPGSGTVIPSFVYGPHLTLLDAFSDNLVYFQDNSLVPTSLAPITYIWDFGDGSYAKGSAVSHNYNYSLVATFTVKLLICGGPPGAIQCYSTTRSVTLFQWHILAIALFILGSAAGSLYAIAYYARHARLPPRGFVTKRVVYWMRR